MALLPSVQMMLQSARQAGRPALSAGSPADARTLVASSRAALGAGLPVHSVQECLLPGRQRPVPARMYLADPTDVRGLLVYVHGGGWVCGTLDDFDGLIRYLAVHTRCAVLALDYRLAPEHPFPQGLMDVEDGLLWAERHRLEHYGAAMPLLVAGDSAGANLVAVATLELDNRVAPKLQALFYPVTDTDFSRPSYLAHSEGMPLTREDMIWFVRHYADPVHWKDKRLALLHRDDLASSPPTWLALAEHDVLLDEGQAYGERLQSVGVPVNRVLAQGLPHGFARMFNLVPQARDVLDQAVQGMAATLAA